MLKMPTHAGAVTFRKLSNQILFLIISSSDGVNWVLPKGHIETGESPEIAVLRELREEAGVIGDIIAPLTVQCFMRHEEEVIVQYFLVQELESTESVENRLLRWVDKQTALQLLTFEDAREILRKAATVLHD